MSKELKALERIETTFSMNKQGKESVYREYTNSIYPYYKDFDLVLNALQRLESIDNAKPSEALKALDRNIVVIREKDYTIIQQFILKVQEQEKVLEIIKEKNVDIGLLKRSENWLDYYTRFKHRTGNNTEITEEEFELLKRWIKCQED